MNMIRNYWYLLIGLIIISCRSPREIVTQYAPTFEEVYPTDTILNSIESKKAMIIVAHDDDMCNMAGTISKLNKKGWEIEILSFPKGSQRDSAQKVACKHILDSVRFFNLDYSVWRKDLNRIGKEDLYKPIPKIQFDQIFNSKSVEVELIKQVNDFNPSVIFSLDNEIGGYGHPEHVFISQLVLDLAKTKKINVRYIYQSVYTPHMMSSIMDRHSKRMIEWGFPGDGWEKAKSTYEVDGLPLPTIQIYIQSEAKEKMDYLNSYNDREKKTIGFYIPAYQEYSAKEYFQIFDREFYKIIKID